MNYLTAPLTALYSPAFYRAKARAAAPQGVLYIFVLSLVATVLFFPLLQIFGMGQLDQFAQWTAQEMPDLILTREGFSTEAPGSFRVRHPQWGNLVVIDTSQLSASPAETQQTLFFVTRKSIYLNSSGAVKQIGDALRIAEGLNLAPGASVRLGDEAVLNFFNRIKPLITGIVLFLFYWVFFLWKMIEAFFAALAGLLFNRMRKSRLGFGTLFNLALFAGTLSGVLFLLKMGVPFLTRHMPFGFFSALLITIVFLALMLRASDEVPPVSPAAKSRPGPRT